MREDILEGAVRVFSALGARRFTTRAVADATGVSVGSIYQYFPHKQGIVFAIHQRAVERAWAEFVRLIDHPRLSPRGKVRAIARYYFLAERDEAAAMGAALEQAERLFSNDDALRRFDEAALERCTDFIRRTLPALSRAEAGARARFLVEMLKRTGKATADLALPRDQVAAWSRRCADALSAQVGL